MKIKTGALIASAALSVGLVTAGAAVAKPRPDKAQGGHSASKVDRPGKVNGGKGPIKKGQQFVFHGASAGSEGLEAGHLLVQVTKGNRWARRAGFVGTTVEFDLSTAKIKVADVNGDGTADLADVASGDAVVIKARLPRSVVPGSVIAAWKLVDKTNPPIEDSPEEVITG